MAGNGGFEDDPLEPGCYSQLLFSEDIPCLDTDACFGFTNFNPSFDDMTNKSPRMLCFGDYANNNGKIVRDKSLDPAQISGPACTGSASVSSSYSTKASALPKSNKKRGGSGREWVQNSGVQVGPSAGSQRASKKSKSDNSTVTGGHAKVAKKEKLGERITALQQLVSPFGKTDTASVLHEALGYIRFLQDQVQVLCSPYLQLPPPSSAAPHSHGNGENKGIEERKDDLRSRGLCLVPMELTLHVADSNGADLWSSAAMANNILSP